MANPYVDLVSRIARAGKTSAGVNAILRGVMHWTALRDMATLDSAPLQALEAVRVARLWDENKDNNVRYNATLGQIYALEQMVQFIESFNP